jgi:sialate O-acetylesterase
MIASGPLFKTAKMDENKILLSFDHIGDGLELRGKGGFEIAGADKNYVPAEVKISGNQLSVQSSKLSNPQFVRYGWRDYFSATLFNSAELPASSFSTEGE